MNQVAKLALSSVCRPNEHDALNSDGKWRPTQKPDAELSCSFAKLSYPPADFLLSIRGGSISRTRRGDGAARPHFSAGTRRGRQHARRACQLCVTKSPAPGIGINAVHPRAGQKAGDERTFL